MSYIAGIGIFDLIGSCDLDLDPMTFIYEHDPYSLEIYRVCENELSTFTSLESYCLTDIQTYRYDQNYTPRRFAGGQK